MKKNQTFLIFITSVAVLGGFLFGYDTAIIAGSIAFIQKQMFPSELWLGIIVSGTTFGAVIGSGFSGYFADKYGRKKLLLSTSFIFMFAAIFMAISQNEIELTLARFVCGLGVGLAAMSSPLYIGEVAPREVRGKLVTAYQVAINFGIVVAYLVSLGLIHLHAVYAQIPDATFAFLGNNNIWRVMLGSAIVPGFLLLVFAFFIPESPRWLIKRGRMAAATTVLGKIETPQAAAQLADNIAKSIATEVSTKFSDLFHRGLKKRTYITVFIAAISQLTGINAIIYYGPEILKKAGLGASNAMISQLILGIILTLACVGAMRKIDKVGRRPLLLYGSMGIVISLFLLGLLYLLHSNIALLYVAIIACYLVAFSYSLGPMPWVIVSEYFPTKIRGRAVSLASMTLFLSTSIVALTFPLLRNGLGTGLTFWLYAIIVCPVTWFAFSKMQETKQKSLEELNNSL